MATDHTTTHEEADAVPERSDTTHDGSGGGANVLYEYRVHVAAALTVAIVAALLWGLESIAVPLAEAPVLRETGGAAAAGGPMAYNMYEGLWLAVRALLGLYIAGVAMLISLLALASWRELAADGEGGDH